MRNVFKACSDKRRSTSKSFHHISRLIRSTQASEKTIPRESICFSHHIVPHTNNIPSSFTPIFSSFHIEHAGRTSE